MAGSIIVFSGADGSGKSTQIERLQTWLAQRHRRTVFFWSRGGYTPGMTTAKTTLRRFTASRAIPPAGPSEARTRAFSRPSIRRCWLMLAILDLMFWYGVWVRCCRWCGKDVICDRYLDDTQLDFEINFPNENVSQWLLWRCLQRMVPRPDVAFLLLIPVDESLRRSQQKNEPFPDSPEVLAQRLDRYRQLVDTSQSADYVVLDGLNPPLDVFLQVVEGVQSAINCQLDQEPSGQLPNHPTGHQPPSSHGPHRPQHPHRPNAL